eukprot:COSAG02_NODE_9418_length_2222_cov_29.435704_2_plen_399_part_00
MNSMHASGGGAELNSPIDAPAAAVATIDSAYTCSDRRRPIRNFPHLSSGRFSSDCCAVFWLASLFSFTGAGSATNPTPAVSEADSVDVPRLALDQLQAALPAGGDTTESLHDSPPEQRRRPDDDDPLVEFNVSGTHYVTSLSTLAAVSGSAFASVVEDQQARRRRRQSEEDGEDVIATFDRDGSSFRWILIYLRWVSAGSTPPLALPQDAGERQQLAEEAAFYGLPELEKYCHRPRLSQFELMQVRRMHGQNALRAARRPPACWTVRSPPGRPCRCHPLKPACKPDSDCIAVAYAQLLGSLPMGCSQRVDLRGCDLSGLHFPFHAVERAELGGTYVGEAKHLQLLLPKLHLVRVLAKTVRWSRDGCSAPHRVGGTARRAETHRSGVGPVDRLSADWDA